MLGEDDRPLVSVSPSDCLLDAILQLSYNKVHRLLIVNPLTGNALHVLTYRRILQFIHICVRMSLHCTTSVAARSTLCLSVCLSVCLSLSLSLCLSVCLSLPIIVVIIVVFVHD